ncbi:MAG: hypothetical protein IPG69_09300 [Flavobacteriales bacterium]|nr:hypothetical protein [Flavobacteriales bacterium]
MDSLLLRLKSEGNNTTRVDLLNAVGIAWTLAHRDTGGIHYLRQAEALANELDYGAGKAYAPMIEAYRYELTDRYPEAILAYKACIERLDRYGIPQGWGSPLMDIRSLFISNGSQPERLDFYTAALERYEQNGPALNVGTCHHGLGGYYLMQRQYALAIEHYMRAREVFRIHEPRSANNETMVIGQVYQQWGNLARAEQFLMEALEGSASGHNAVSETAELYLNLGDLEAGLADTARAMDYYRRGRALLGPADRMSRTLFRSRLIPCHLWVGELDTARIELDSLNLLRDAEAITLSSIDGRCEVDLCNHLYQLKLGDAPLAERYLERALEAAIAMKDLPLMLKYRKMLAARYGASGDLPKEAEQLRAYTRLNDSLQAVADQRAIAGYEGTVKERESALELQRRETSIKQQRIVLLSAGGGLVVLLVLGYVIYRGKKRSDELLLNILPAEVAEELKAKGHADAKHFDNVTILFTDFKGFTEASEKLSPQELVEELNTCFKAFDGIIITARGIEKIKTIGDAYMCAGGLPVPASSTPMGVVHAALEMQAFMIARKKERDAQGKPAFEMRVGIHTGPVVAGIVGVKKFAYDIWGDTVNTASRMESSGEVGQVNISESTYALVKDAVIDEDGVASTHRVDPHRTSDGTGRPLHPTFTFTPRGKVQAKGKGEMEMYFVQLSANKSA